jgi:hypothetical protein
MCPVDAKLLNARMSLVESVGGRLDFSSLLGARRDDEHHALGRGMGMAPSCPHGRYRSRIVGFASAILLLSVLAVFMWPQAGMCYERERITSTPLFDVVLSRSVSGISGEADSAVEPPGLAGKFKTDYRPSKDVTEPLSAVEAGHLLGGRRGADVRRDKETGYGMSNPRRYAESGGLGAAWAKSIALMKEVRERRRQRREGIASGRFSIQGDRALAPSPLSFSVKSPAPAAPAGAEERAEDPSVLCDYPEGTTYQPGDPTMCYTPDETTGIETVCYVAGEGGQGVAVSTVCYVQSEEPGMPPQAQATVCYTVADDGDGNGVPDDGNVGGTAVATLCYTTAPDDDHNGVPDDGQPGGHANETVCYVQEEGEPGAPDPNPGGVACATICYKIVDESGGGPEGNEPDGVPDDPGGTAVSTACFLNEDPDAGPDDPPPPQSTMCFVAEDKTGGGAGGDEPDGKIDDPGGTPHATVCYVMEDKEGGGPDGDEPDGNPDDPGGTPQSTVCYKLEDKEGGGAEGDEPDGNPDDPNGTGQSTLCYVLDEDTGEWNATPTMCYTAPEDPNGAEGASGEAQETMCYAIPEGGTEPEPIETCCYRVGEEGTGAGGEPESTVCYRDTGDDAGTGGPGEASTTRCYFVSEGGDNPGGEGAATACYVVPENPEPSGEYHDTVCYDGEDPEDPDGGEPVDTICYIEEGEPIPPECMTFSFRDSDRVYAAGPGARPRRGPVTYLAAPHLDPTGDPCLLEFLDGAESRPWVDPAREVPFDGDRGPPPPLYRNRGESALPAGREENRVAPRVLD